MADHRPNQEYALPELLQYLFPSPAVTLTTCGLLLDIGGVVLIFKYGLPASINRSGMIGLGTPDETGEHKAAARRYDRWARVGLVMLIAGFALQMLASYA
jgi:hypothetical protein